MQPIRSSFSLWLIPEFASRQHANLRSIIHRLSRNFNTPIFDPHVTLLSDIENSREVVLARTKQFADMQSPFEIKLGALDSQQSPMQIFFASVEESDDLSNARRTAFDIMFGPRTYEYFAHVSLAYGNLTKEQVAVLHDEVHHSTFRPEKNDFIAWGVSVWNTPSQEVKSWSEEQYFKFRTE